MKTRPRLVLRFALPLACLLPLVLLNPDARGAADGESKKTASSPPSATAEGTGRGRYLVTILGCASCHSPHDERGRLVPGREFSGHPEGAPLPEWDPSLLKRNIASTTSPTLTAWAGPFGVSVAGNLTPDKETGIGKTTAEQLIKSWKHGGMHWKKPDRPVLPPMPIEAYRELPDDDIRAIHAYLMSLKPIKNKCPDSVLSPPPPTAAR